MLIWSPLAGVTLLTCIGFSMGLTFTLLTGVVRTLAPALGVFLLLLPGLGVCFLVEILILINVMSYLFFLIRNFLWY